MLSEAALINVFSHAWDDHISLDGVFNKQHELWGLLDEEPDAPESDLYFMHNMEPASLKRVLFALYLGCHTAGGAPDILPDKSVVVQTVERGDTCAAGFTQQTYMAQGQLFVEWFFTFALLHDYSMGQAAGLAIMEVMDTYGHENTGGMESFVYTPSNVNFRLKPARYGD